MADRIIENPIINSPYRPPDRYFKFDDEGITNEVVPGRRPSQYFIPVPKPRKKGQQIELDFAEFTADKIRLNDFVNEVRGRVDIWRKQGYQSVTPTTRRLLEFWSDPERDNPILFAQREAAETAIYLAEAAQKQGDVWIRNRLGEINHNHNQDLHRVALKMATGSGKTVVMAMLIAWQTLNKVAQPNDARFAKRFLVITPGLTIKDRLRVLLPEDDQNYYKLRGLVPADLHDDLGQAKVVIANYHQLQRRETKAGKTVGSLTKELLAGTSGAESPFRESWGQMVARVTRDLGGSSGIVVFNAAREATRGLGFDVLLVCAFAFDPQANESVKEFSIGRVRVVLVRMNSDLAMGDVLLKKTGSGNLFTIFGEPDIDIARDGDELTVEIKGVDVYNPTTGEIRSSDTREIALWMIDTDYDGESFFVRHCYFTGDNDPYKRLKAALKADIDPEAWESLYQTKSRPFKRPEKGKIAVKVINHYGDEVLQVYDV